MTGTSSPKAHRDAGAQREATQALTIVSLATALVLVVFTLPLTTLAATSEALGAGAGAQAWILSAMPLGCAIGLLPGGALADDYGRKRVFVAGLAIMGATLAAGGLATGPIPLILLRVAQGMGGSGIMAAGLGLLAQSFPDPTRRRHATGIWAMALGAGVAAGPLLAAALEVLGGWAMVYLVEGIISLTLAAAAHRVLRESHAGTPRPLDLGGTITLGGGIASLLAAMTQARGTNSGTLVLGLIALGLLLLTAFVLIEKRRAAPMLNLDLFRRPDFTGATLGAYFSGAGVLGLMSVSATVLERAYGLSPVIGALVLMAWSATSSVTAMGARYLPESATPPRIIVAGLLACGIGQFATGFADEMGGVIGFIPGMLLAGAANGYLNAALGQQAIASVPPRDAAIGSGANNTARYLGSATGLTLVALMIANAPGGDILAGWRQAAIVSAGLSVLGAVLCLVTLRPRRREPEPS
ncbi:MFS transporter [Novosphingobium profundi]|uniref:MFS transporter n=1 Tax=Novosphingobium profundi TaxID=1774954 RepID=UPI001CFE1F14|nr:MFS transporter [Novosphingobium profundi]